MNKVCDYITLDLNNANVDGAESSWYIPSSAYLSNSKGLVCLVSIADASLLKLAIDDDVVVVYKSVLNGYSSNNNCVLGHFTRVYGTEYNTDVAHDYTPNNTRFMTPARPNNITLKFITTDGVDKTGIDNGHITLKFEYLDPDTTKQNDINQSYKSAF